MLKLDISQLNDDSLGKLVESRWKSSSELWETVEKTYKANTAVYENRADWLQYIPERRRRFRVQANRVFVDMEAVINSLIANPPGINVIAARDGQASQDFARRLETYFRKKYIERNIKETVRMGIRNLYFGRLIVIKAFWNPLLGPGGDFDFRSINPRNVRIGKYARKEQDSEFVIEEIEDNLCAVVQRFPDKKDALMQRYGYEKTAEGESRMYVENIDVKYKEAWIQEYVIFKLENIVLGKIKNPYWDWDGVLMTSEEEKQFNDSEGQARRDLMQNIKLDQGTRKAAMEQAAATSDAAQRQPAEGVPTGGVEPTQGATSTATPQTPDYKPYLFNYFDMPRKPYIFGTIFNNENTPIGRTDMITLSAELQRGVDKRKMDIDENCEFANGILKVDSSVMDKANAQRIRFETKGIIWGKGVATGVSRETGVALPQMVFDDMVDSRNEIDSIMAASSAFRGEREGQETKAGRLALIQQSFLRLNELVQLTDFIHHEIFSWGMQLAKTRYTEYHYAKWMGKEGAREVIEVIQDDFETGSEVTVIAGKSLPVDDEFKFEQAQNDFEKGALSLTDYLERAGYDDPKTKGQNAVVWAMNKPMAVGLPPEVIQQIAPPAEEKPPSVTVNYADLPPDAQVQLLAKIGIQADPNILVAEKMKVHADTHKVNADKNELAHKALDAKQQQPPSK